MSIPTINKWIREGLLEMVPRRSPTELTARSVMRVEQILGHVRATYPTRHWTRALAAYLHDQDLQRQDWLAEGAAQFHRGEYVER